MDVDLVVEAQRPAIVHVRFEHGGIESLVPPFTVRVADRRERQLTLDRRDMDDHTGPLREHGRQQRAIEPHRRHQVEIDLFPPRLVVECGEPAGRRLRAAEHVDDDVDAAQVVEGALSDKGATLSRRDVRRDVVHAGKRAARNRASRGHHARAVLSQHLDDGGADSLRPGRDERSAARESGSKLMP